MDTAWTSATNWNPNTAPMANDDLVFPLSGLKKTNVNTLAAGTAFNSITVDAGYDLRGQQVRTSLVNANISSSTSVLQFPIDGGPGLTVSTTGLGALYVAGTVSGTGGLTKTGPGTLRFTINQPNTFTGPLTVAEGTLEMARAAPGSSVPAGSSLVIGNGATANWLDDAQLGASTPVTVNPGGTANIAVPEVFGLLTLNDGSVTGVRTGPHDPRPAPSGVNVGGPGGSAINTDQLDLRGEIRTFDVADTPDPVDLNVVADIISSTPGGGLMKTGEGTMQTNRVSSFTGPTTVAAGRFLVGGGRHDGPIDVSGGVLGGTGFTGPVNATAGAVAPGSSPGSLFSNGARISAPAALRVELGPGPGASDVWAVSGPLDVTGASLELSGSDPGVPSQIIVRHDGTTGPVVGTFAGLPERAPVTVGGSTLYITYRGGDGNDIALISDISVEFDATAKKKQQVKSLGVFGECPRERCIVVVTGMVKTKKGGKPGNRAIRRAKPITLPSKQENLAAGERQKIKLTPKKKQLAKLVRLLERGGKATATIDVVATDALFNEATERTRVKLRP